MPLLLPVNRMPAAFYAAEDRLISAHTVFMILFVIIA